MQPLSIGAAAALLRTSPRMLRYRERLGLLAPARSRGGGHRRYGEAELDAAATAIAVERRYRVSPAAVAFALRVLTEPRVLGDVADLGRRTGRIGPPPLAALAFDQQKALRLLHADQARRAVRPGSAP